MSWSTHFSLFSTNAASYILNSKENRSRGVLFPPKEWIRFASCPRYVSLCSPFRRAGVKKLRVVSCQGEFRDPNAVLEHKDLDSVSVDFVIVGAGVIGLSIAHKILTSTNLKVAVVDAEKPFAGATGAGQGYIWMGHRTPGTPGWDLARRGTELWHELVQDLPPSYGSSEELLGWKTTGSLLLASQAEENPNLEMRAKLLSEAGLECYFLDPLHTLRKEPALFADVNSAQIQSSSNESLYDRGSLFIPSDSQIDAKLAVEFFLKECRSDNFHNGKYLECFYEPMESLIRSNNGTIIGVKTNKRKFFCSSVILCTGVWSKPLMITFSEMEKECGFRTEKGVSRFVPNVIPYKGHLIVLENSPLNLNHALMEVNYTSNYDDKQMKSPILSPSSEPNLVNISFTATMDHKKRLLIGSSRKFVGIDNNDIEKDVLELIVKRAKSFLPTLGKLSFEEIFSQSTIRTGLRPHSVDGMPFIGSCPELDGLIFATGHDGSGLVLALVTAEMVLHHLSLQTQRCYAGAGDVNVGAFLPGDRLLPH